MSQDLQIAFLTGSSRPGNPALSPEQKSFLAQLSADGRKLIPLNFPYSTSEPCTFQETPLLLASLNNAGCYLTSMSTRFRELYREQVSRLVGSARHTLFLAGSCGLELFNNLRLGQDLESRCILLAYGPVARRAPKYARIVSICGRNDWISKVGFRGQIRHSVDCGHMDYLRSADVLAIAQELCQALSRCCNTSG